MTCENREILIIGGGLGGLFTGALLAKNGAKVRALEKNAIIGGGLQCFHRNGKSFETGMHILGGFTPTGTLNKICSYLGILDNLQIEHLPSECMDTVRIGTEPPYRLAGGREGFTDSLIRYFPEEKEEILSYMEAIYRLSASLPLFNLRERTDYLINPPEEFTLPASQLIARHVENPRLRALLAYLNPLYGGVADSTPAFIHAVINILYINGESRFIGGSQQLADALKGVIERNGGEVLNRKTVSSVLMADGNIESVHTADGDSYRADTYISAIHPDALLNLLPEHAFRKAYAHRLREIPNSCSAFSLYIDLAPESFPYIPSTNYVVESEEQIWEQEKWNRDGEIRSFMYMTPPEPNQGPWASRLLVYSLMSFEEVRRWEHTRLGDRGEDYEIWKKRYKDNLIQRLEKIYPGFKAGILHAYSASPLTVRDYYATKEGAIFGYRKDASNLSFSHIGSSTKIPNLLLTGQNIGLHGICGVPLNAIITAEELLGKNYLVREINRHQDL